MATNISQWTANGLHAIQVGARDGSGRFTGFAKLTAASTGIASGARRLLGAISAPSPVADVNRVRRRGDDGYIATFIHDAEPGDYNLGFDVIDQDMETFAIGGQTYTVGEWDFHLRGSSARTFQDCITLLTRDAQSMEAASRPAPGYDNLLVLSSKYLPTPGQMEFQGGEIVQYAGSADRVQMLPFGVTPSTAFVKTDGITMEFWTEYPPSLTCFVGDGIIVAIPLAYAPINVAKTKFWNFATGALLTTSSVNVSGKTGTVSVAPASAAFVFGLYETTEI